MYWTFRERLLQGLAIVNRCSFNMCSSIIDSFSYKYCIHLIVFFTFIFNQMRHILFFTDYLSSCMTKVKNILYFNLIVISFSIIIMNQKKSTIFPSNWLLIGYIDLLHNTHKKIIQRALKEIMCILVDSCLPEITRGNQEFENKAHFHRQAGRKYIFIWFHILTFTCMICLSIIYLKKTLY